MIVDIFTYLDVISWIRLFSASVGQLNLLKSVFVDDVKSLVRATTNTTHIEPPQILMISQ